jgi:hypothetical protein
VEPRQGAVGAEVSAGNLTLIPDAAMLNDPATIYPVYVDPTWTKKTAAKSAWTVLRWSFPNKSYYKASSIMSEDATRGMMRVGFNDWDGPSYRDRSLFAFDVTPFRYKHIYKATFSLTQQWSGAACGYTGTARTELHWLKNSFSATTNWNTAWNSSGSGWGPVLATSDAVRRYGYSCGPKKAEFAVTNQMTQLAASGAGVFNLGMRAKSETDKFSWKRYKNDAGLSIEYNTKPNAPATVKVTGKDCVTGSARPYVTTKTPSFTAGRASDPDVGQQALTTRFYWWKSGQSRNGNDFVQGTSANPAPVNSGAVPAAKQLVEAQTYVWQASTSDDVNDIQWAGLCEFTVDTIAPPQPAAVTSTSYPVYDPNNSGAAGSGGVGASGTFTIQPPSAGTADVIAYAYTMDTSVAAAAAPTVAPGTGGAASVTLAPVHDGLNKVRVWSKDRAGLFSATYFEYTFKVASGSGPAAEWTFENVTTRGTDDTGHNNTVTVSGATVTPGRAGVGSALLFNGVNQYAATAGPVTQPNPTAPATTQTVRTDATFSVSAWVNMTATGATRTVLAADGTRKTPFSLSYLNANNKWRFVMGPADADGADTAVVYSDAVAVAGKWTHLCGTYDVSTHTLRLYVNGVLQSGSATLSGGFNASGSWTIGRAKWTGVPVDYFYGAIDDVRVYSFVPTAAAIKDLAKPLPPAVSFPADAQPQVGDPVQVTFNGGGDTNVTKFKYSVGASSLDQTATPGTAGGSVTVTVTAPANPGDLTVWAAGWDEAAGLVGASQHATVTVKGLPGIGGVILDADSRTPVAGAAVTLTLDSETADGPVLSTTSGADGSYAFTSLTPGNYILAATAGGGCGLFRAGRTGVQVPADSQKDLVIQSMQDKYGYACQASDGYPFIPANDSDLPLTGDDAVTQVGLPFPVTFYGPSYSSAWVDTNGILTFVNPNGSHPANSSTVPSPAPPNGMIAAFWDDLVVDSAASVSIGTIGSAPSRQFVVEWYNVYRADAPSERVTFEIVFDELTGFIFLNYADLDPASESERGSAATVGIESAGGSVGLQYSYNEAALADGKAIAFVSSPQPNPIPLVTVSGTVTDAATGAVSPGAKVTVDDAELSATADAAGNYTFAGLEANDYTVSAVKGEHCGKLLTVDVDAHATADVDMPVRPLSDAYGNTCTAEAVPWTAADDTVLGLSGDDGRAQVIVPFSVWLYGQSYTTAWVDIDGLVAFAPYTGIPWQSTELPSPAEDAKPNAAVYAFWDDWVVDSSASIRTATVGSAPNRKFVIEWRNVYASDDPTARVSFEVVFTEAGDTLVTWNDISASQREQGSLAAVGIENADGSVALVHSFHQPVLASGQGVRFSPGPAPIGTIGGMITCTGVPAAGVSVTVGGQNTTTAADGTYQLTNVPGGPYTVLATPGAGSACYGTSGQPVSVSPAQRSAVNIDLPASTGTRYTVTEGAKAFVPANDAVLPLTGDDGIAQITLPFPAKLYGQTYNTAWVQNDGLISFEDPVNFSWDSGPIPSERESNRPNTAVYPLWDDWVVDSSSSVRTATIGTAPNRKFMVEWRNVSSLLDTTAARVSFEVVFNEGGDIEIAWDGVDVNFYEQGGDATIGVENADGTVAFQYSYRNPVVVNGRGLLLHPVTS